MELLNRQWFDENSSRAYPLFDGASRLDLTGLFTIPNDLIVDLRIAAPADYDATKFYISKLSAFGSGLVLTIACTGKGDVANVTVPLDSFVDYSSFSIAPLPAHPQVGGAMVIGVAASAIAAGSGSYSFAQSASQILPTVVFPAAPAVSSITFVDRFGVQTRLTGAIVLEAGPNGALGLAGQTISIGMQTGVLIEDPCACKDTGGRSRLPIRSINGVVPDVSGNLVITPVGCPALVTGEAEIKLSDTCAQPCCGSAELNAVAQAAKDINLKQGELANRVGEIEAGLRNLQNYAAG